MSPPNATPTLAPLGLRSGVKNTNGTWEVTDAGDIAALLSAGWYHTNRFVGTILNTRLSFDTIESSQYLPLVF